MVAVVMMSLEIARSNDPITSLIGADHMYSRGLSRLQQVVLALFVQHGDMTDSELTDRYHSTPGLPVVADDTPRKRRSDLTRLRMLVETGERRRNHRGQMETVWGVSWCEESA